MMNFAALIGSPSEILYSLVIMLVFAKLLAEIFVRFGQPAVVGEILAGIIIGPSVLALVNPSEIISTLAEVGVIFLLFTVGLETKPQAILRVGKRAFLVATLGVIVPFAAGYCVTLFWNGSKIEAMFVGATLVATSVGITARVLGNLGLLDAPTARIILGAAVIDDILGLLILSVVSSVNNGDFDYVLLLKTTGLAILFTVLIATVGARIVIRIAPRIGQLWIGDSFYILGLVLCLGLSYVATLIGMAAIIGAFLAGMALAEATESKQTMHKQTQGVMEFLVPFFLVNIGMSLDISVFKDISTVWLALIVTILAILTKFIGCGLGSYGIGWRRSAQIGVGMVPRGEVGIVVAQIGLGLGVITPAFFAAILFMAIFTTLIAPPFIKWAFDNEEAAHGTIDAEDAGGILPKEKLSPLG